MQDILIVVDMQNDFITGVLGTAEAQAIVPRATEKIKHFTGKVFFTRDTHGKDYLQTREGQHLPVEHCIRGTSGWEICPELQPFCQKPPIDKPAFGSAELGALLAKENEQDTIRSITLIGLCTDICVISRIAVKSLSAGGGNHCGRRLLRRRYAGKPPNGTAGHAILPDTN